MAGHVDALYFALVAIAAFFTFLISALILFFAIRYRKERNPHATQIHGSTALELMWTGIPLGIVMIIFVWSAVIFFMQTRPPKGAMEIYAVGKQWMWKFQHTEGQREINQLHVPAGRDVRMIMTSQDVIHSFYVPVFRIKADVLPGRYTSTWFHATTPGRYHLFCAEYCGTQHSGMVGEVIVMDPADYDRWAAGGVDGSLASAGEKSFQHYGCSMCHRSDAAGRGPNLIETGDRKAETGKRPETPRPERPPAQSAGLRPWVPAENRLRPERSPGILAVSRSANRTVGAWCITPSARWDP